MTTNRNKILGLIRVYATRRVRKFAVNHGLGSPEETIQALDKAEAKIWADIEAELATSCSHEDTFEVLEALTTALGDAFISSWQSTEGWADELKAAEEHVRRMKELNHDW